MSKDTSGPFAVCCYSVFKDRFYPANEWPAPHFLSPRRAPQLNRSAKNCQYLFLSAQSLSSSDNSRWRPLPLTLNSVTQGPRQTTVSPTRCQLLILLYRRLISTRQRLKAYYWKVYRRQFVVYGLSNQIMMRSKKCSLWRV